MGRPPQGHHRQGRVGPAGYAQGQMGRGEGQGKPQRRIHTPSLGRLEGRTPRALGEGGGSTSEEALNGAHEGVQRGAGVALAEVGRGEASDEAVNAEAAHGLVAQAQAGVWVAAHDEPPAADDVAVVVNREDA